MYTTFQCLITNRALDTWLNNLLQTTMDYISDMRTTKNFMTFEIMPVISLTTNRVFNTRLHILLRTTCGVFSGIKITANYSMCELI